MGEIVLVRHGETAWTLSGQHTSYTDLPLTAHGEEQARAVASVIEGRRIGLALVSPMARARRTAELAGLVEPQVEPDLMEWGYGGYEGVTTAQILRDRPDWDLWTDGAVPGAPGHPGESPVDVGARVDRVLARAAAVLGTGADVVLVAHGHVLRVLTARYLGLPASAGSLFRLGTGSVSRLGTEHGNPVITAWNAVQDDGLLAGAPLAHLPSR